MAVTIVCDQCGQPSVAAAAGVEATPLWRLLGAAAGSLCVGYDFCSAKCLLAWVVVRADWK